MRRRNIDRYSADSLSHYRPTIDPLSTNHRPTIDRLSTNYRPTVDRYIDQLSTAISTAMSTDISVDITHSKQDPRIIHHHSYMSKTHSWEHNINTNQMVYLWKCKGINFNYHLIRHTNLTNRITYYGEQSAELVFPNILGNFPAFSLLFLHLLLLLHILGLFCQ